MQHQTTPMSKKKFRIGDLAKELKVKKFVIRFWEKEFELKSERSEGGQRFYTEHDFKTFNTIKHLLYTQGFTIAGAKINLKDLLHSKSNNDEQPKEITPTQTMTAATKIAPESNETRDQILDQLNLLKKQLNKFKQMLD